MTTVLLCYSENHFRAFKRNCALFLLISEINIGRFFVTAVATGRIRTAQTQLLHLNAHFYSCLSLLFFLLMVFKYNCGGCWKEVESRAELRGTLVRAWWRVSIHITLWSVSVWSVWYVHVPWSVLVCLVLIIAYTSCRYRVDLDRRYIQTLQLRWLIFPLVHFIQYN